MEIINIILAIVIIYLAYRFFKWLQTKQKRYISKEVKEAVLKRYFNMCAVCPENNINVMEFHHRHPYSERGDNGEMNIIPLCPYHHALITRYPQTRGRPDGEKN